MPSDGITKVRADYRTFSQGLTDAITALSAAETAFQTAVAGAGGGDTASVDPAVVSARATRTAAAAAVYQAYSREHGAGVALPNYEARETYNAAGHFPPQAIP